MNSFQYGFFNELEKVAARSYVKKIRRLLDEGNFEEARKLARQVSEDMIAGRIKPRESGIKQLGEGSSNVVDLVHTPQFGLTVRKVGVERGNTPKLVEHLGETEYPSFTAILGKRDLDIFDRNKAGISYWEPSFGEHPAVAQKLNHRRRGVDEALAGWDRANERTKKEEFKWGPLDRKKLKTLDSMKKIYRDIVQQDIPPGQFPQLDADRQAIKKALGHSVRDVRPLNMVGDKVVDAELRGGDFYSVSKKLEGNDARKALGGVVNSPRKPMTFTPIGARRRITGPETPKPNTVESPTPKSKFRSMFESLQDFYDAVRNRIKR